MASLRKRFLGTGILLALLWQAAGTAFGGPGLKSDQHIQIVTSEFAPYNYTENGAPTGICTEIVQAVLKEVGMEIPITILPWSRAYQKALKQKDILIFTIARTPERENLFHWVGVLGTGKDYLFSLKSSQIRLDSLDEVRKYRVGAARDDIRADWLRRQGVTDLDLVVHSRMNAVKLINRRIDLWAENELAAIHTVRKLGKDPDAILFRSLLLDIRPPLKGYLAFSREAAPKLVEQFSKALEVVQASESYKKITQKYYTPGP